MAPRSRSPVPAREALDVISIKDDWRPCSPTSEVHIVREFGERDDLPGARSLVPTSPASAWDVNLQGSRIIGALLVDADISGLIDGLDRERR